MLGIGSNVQDMIETATIDTLSDDQNALGSKSFSLPKLKTVTDMYAGKRDEIAKQRFDKQKGLVKNNVKSFNFKEEFQSNESYRNRKKEELKKKKVDKLEIKKKSMNHQEFVMNNCSLKYRQLIDKSVSQKILSTSFDPSLAVNSKYKTVNSSMSSKYKTLVPNKYDEYFDKYDNSYYRYRS